MTYLSVFHFVLYSLLVVMPVEMQQLSSQQSADSSAAKVDNNQKRLPGEPNVHAVLNPLGTS